MLQCWNDPSILNNAIFNLSSVVYVASYSISSLFESPQLAIGKQLGDLIIAQCSILSYFLRF